MALYKFLQTLFLFTIVVFNIIIITTTSNIFTAWNLNPTPAISNSFNIKTFGCGYRLQVQKNPKSDGSQVLTKTEPQTLYPWPFGLMNFLTSGPSDYWIVSPLDNI